MSCISLPDCRADEADAQFDPANTCWPALVQGIRVYAVSQPPKVASELLRLASLLERISELENGPTPD